MAWGYSTLARPSNTIVLNQLIHAIASGTATAAVDYGSTSSPVVILAGQTSAPITIPILDDALDESNEDFVVSLGTPTNATLGAQTDHTVTILDGDAAPTVEFVAASSNVIENGTAAIIEVQLSAVSGQDVIVPFTLADGSATAADYGPGSSPIVIPAGLNLIGFAAKVMFGFSPPGAQVSSIWRAAMWGS